MDTLNNTVSGETTHFSTYGIVGAPGGAPTNSSPTATINNPADGSSFPSGNVVAFQGVVNDPEEGVLPGSAASWSSDLDGPLGTGESIGTNSLSVGTHTITLTGTDSQGAIGTDQVDVTITGAGCSGNVAPEGSITAPADESTFTVGVVVTLEGTGTDAEDGTLSGSALAWSSDLDGALGTGESLSLSSLSIGTHEISLTVTDSCGAEEEENLELFIVGS